MSAASKDIRIMAAALYHAIEGRPAWHHATKADRANYLALCRQFIQDVKAEQQRQPIGQKEVA